MDRDEFDSTCKSCTEFYRVRRYVFYVFFRFQKTWLLTFFFEMAYQKLVKIFSKSLVLNPSKWVHILRSVITVIQLPADPRVWSILSHCWTSSVNDVRFWQQWRGTINIKQPWKIIRMFFAFFRFLKIQKKTWLFTFFWVVAHVFSNTGAAESRSSHRILVHTAAYTQTTGTVH